MEKDANHFLLLLSLNKGNAQIGRAFLARIKSAVDATAGPLWIDSKGIGVFVTSTHPAWKIWELANPLTLDKDQRMDLQDCLVLQVGPGFHGSPSSKAVAWMNSRFPTRKRG